SATVTPGEKRSVSESLRVVPRRRSDTPTTESLADPRRHRTGSPARSRRSSGTAARRSARSAASQSKMLPHSAVNSSDATPPRKRHRQRPDAATMTTRRGSSVPTTTGRRSSPRPRRASIPSHDPLGTFGESASGGRLSHTKPDSAGANGDAGAADGYHSPSVGVVTISASGPRANVRGGPNAAVSP